MPQPSLRSIALASRSVLAAARLVGARAAARISGTSPEARYVGLGVMALIVIVVGLAFGRTAGVSQPIAFNHRKHTQDLKLECEFCHPYVKTGAHPGLPDAATCAACHQAPIGESAEAARLTALIEAGQPIVFRKLFGLAPHVFYTHRRHVGIAGIECQSCHGKIALTRRPPTRPLVRITMNFCRDCHRAQNQTQDCVACHR